jgi:hypothetical protein
MLDLLFLFEPKYKEICRRLYFDVAGTQRGEVATAELHKYYLSLGVSPDVVTSVVNAHEEVLAWGAGTGFERIILVNWKTGSKLLTVLHTALIL